jgi:serine/threonine protein kinase
MAGVLRKKWFFSSSQSLGPSTQTIAKQPDVEEMYTIGKELGTGTFGVVRAVIEKATGGRYALKTINKEKLDEHQMKYLEAECEVLKLIDSHPNIVKLHEIYDTPKKLHIVMEVVTGGQLLERLATKGLYSEAVTAQCIRSIAEAISYCHSRNVVHRDLKPENILLSDDTDDAVIKLADFGLSKLYSTEAEMMFTQCGTPEFVAPEVMAGNGYTAACDIWSLGVMMYIMLCGYLPFNGSSVAELFDSISKSSLTFPREEWDMISPEAKDCIQAMLQRNPSTRPSADQLMQMAWLAGVAGAVPPMSSSSTSLGSSTSLAGAQVRIIASYSLMQASIP